MAKRPGKAGGLPSIKSTVNQLIRSRRIRENITNLYKMNKHKGFDCPGCAWGDDKSGAFRFCENGAKAVAWESTSKKVDASFLGEYTLAELATKTDYWLESQGRLVQPLRYDAASDTYIEISWDDAFALIARNLQNLQSPNELELYTSGRASNEASFIYQLFGRAFGTNNFPDCSNMCHEASGVALKQSIGVGKGTVVLSDFSAAECIFVYGQNPGTNHPRMLNALSKAAKNGTRIVSINNLREVALEKFASPQKPTEFIGNQGVSISCAYYTPRLGGDFAFVRGLAKAIFEQFPTCIDQGFIAEHTRGFEQYKTLVEASSWEHLEASSGVSKTDICEAAGIFASAATRISTWAMGITQHLHSVATIREIVSLHLLCGAIGKPGSGLSPVRGHSNVQGNRTMGILETPGAAFNEALEAVFNFTPPTEPGHKTYHALKALHKGTSKVLICLGGNLAAAAADTAYTVDAIRNASFVVNIATKLNRTHVNLTRDGLLLPCLGRTEIDMQASGEQLVTVEDTFSMVHGSAGSTEPLSSELMSETAIIANIAKHTLGSKIALDWDALADDYATIRDLIAQTIPGFADFNRKVAQPGGFYLQNAAAVLTWNTTSGKAHFSEEAVPASIFPDSVAQCIRQLQQPVFVLQTLRSHDQYNTTIYGMNDRYRGVEGQRNVVFMNQHDMQQIGLESGQRVDITTVWDDERKRAVTGFVAMPYDIPQGNVAAYYPETNPLIPIESVGRESLTPTSKSVPVIINPSLSRVTVTAM